MTLDLDARPIIVAIAGPNGAGKSTFYEAFLRPAGLRFVNADELSRELGVPAYEAAVVADRIRHALVDQRESFVFETVFSDPVGDRVGFLRDAASKGYTVVLCFIGLDGADTSEQRVSMRVAQGGHDVPSDKIAARFDRTLQNLARAIRELPSVHVYDNSDLNFRKVAEFENGGLVFSTESMPRWLPQM